MTDVTFRPPGKVLREFMRDNTFFRGIRGPVGSAKTSTCLMEVFRRACDQKVLATGKRSSRWAIVRNTYPMLRTTTMKTWEEWFPADEWGKVIMNPPPFTHHLRKGNLDAEIMFVALDREDDVKKLLSMDLTGAFVNEAREVPKSIIDALTMRVGRYPSMRVGGPSWSGIIADTNAPDEHHWWPIMSGEVPMPDHIPREQALMLSKPDNWKFYNQPAAMHRVTRDGELVGYKTNPAAENIENLVEGYYPRLIAGKSRDWISVYVINELGAIFDGKPVYSDYSTDLHAAEAHFRPELPIFAGVDFGLTPAIVFAQRQSGVVTILHEIVSEDMDISTFARMLMREIPIIFPGIDPLRIRIYGDPSGDNRSQTDKNTPFKVLRAQGFNAFPAGTNDVAIRLSAVVAPLTRLVQGKPAFQIDPVTCKTLIRGFEGGYHYRRLKMTGESYDTEPEKNRFSHVHDALQYLMLGMGEARELLGQGRARTVNARRNLNPFASQPRKRVRSAFNRAL